MITRKEIEMFTSIEYVERDVNRLEILEALIINAGDYEINRQDTGETRILKLYGDRNHRSGINNNVQPANSQSWSLRGPAELTLIIVLALELGILDSN